MNKEQQDKIWAELSKESKETILSQYNGDTSGAGSQFEDRKKLYHRLFGSHNLNRKPKTYEDVARELFEGKKSWCNKTFGISRDTDMEHIGINNPNLCTSHKQAEKLLAINKLLNVASFLNKNEDGTTWKPDWKDGEQEKYFIGFDNSENKKLVIKKCWFGQYEIIYFRTEKLAQQAIQILGEETIRLALTTDY